MMHVRVYRADYEFEDGSKAMDKYFGSKFLAKKYFGQLTKQQVFRLYEMYKIDFDMFGL